MKFELSKDPLVIIRCVAFWLSVAAIGFWAADRSPPFTLLSYTVTDASRGGVVEIDAVVRRDVERNCSVQYSRYLYDSRGFRYDMVPSTQYMTAQGLRRLIESNPDTLRIYVPIPETLPQGPTKFQTQLKYSCGSNPLHLLWPIEITMEMEFQVTRAL